MTNQNHPVIDLATVKSKQQLAWGSGDYSRIGVTLQITGEQLCEAMDLRAGQSVLDIAAGNGNATLAAARRFCNVTSTDYVQSLLDQSCRRAEAEGMSIHYQLADVENLPFDKNTFDYVISTFGVMFAPNQAQSAAEMQRVCKPGGKIGMANWTASGFIGQLFKTISGYIPPAPGVSSPADWGSDEFINQNFSACSQIDSSEKHFNFRYESPGHWLDLFGTYYGPLLKVFEALDENRRSSLHNDVLDLIDQFNTATDGTVVLPSHYSEVVITK